MSDFLFANPRIAFGVAGLVDLGGEFDEYNVSSSETEADTRATLSDWVAVGHDLQDAINKYDLENPAR